MRNFSSFRKKVSIVLAVSLLIFVVTAPAFSGDKVYKWRMGTWAPRGLIYDKTVYNPFCALVKKMSNGRLVIQMVYDGEGVAATELLNALRTGLVEMGEPAPSYHAGDFPAGVIEMGLPGIYGDFGWQLFMQYHSDYEKVIDAAYQSFNIQHIGKLFWPGVYLLTKKPINTLSDLQGAKIRAPGAYGKALRRLGVQPVVTSFGEMYTAAATGLIEGTAGAPLSDYKDLKMQEVLKYIYPLPLSGYQATPILVNNNKWKSLPNDLKEILRTAARWIGIECYATCKLIERESAEAMIKAGMQWCPQPSQGDAKKWKAAGVATWEDYKKINKYCKQLVEIQTEFQNKYDLQ